MIPHPRDDPDQWTEFGREDRLRPALALKDLGYHEKNKGLNDKLDNILNPQKDDYSFQRPRPTPEDLNREYAAF